MSEENTDSQKTSRKDEDGLSLKRGFEFLKTVLDIEGSIKSLKEENKQLREQVAALERDIIALKGQHSVLMDFIKSAMNDRIDARAREATAEAVDRYLSFLSASPSTIIAQTIPDGETGKKQIPQKNRKPAKKS